MWTGLSVRVVRASGSPRAFSPRDDKGDGFTLHPSIFTLPSLAFLKGDAVAYVDAAVAGGAGAAPRGTQARPAGVPGTTP